MGSNLMFSNKSEASRTSKYTSEVESRKTQSKRGPNGKGRTGAKSQLGPDSRNNPSEFDDIQKREKALAIFENQNSGDPFAERGEVNATNMYYPEGNNSRPNTNSLNQSIRSKQAKVKSSFPEIRKNGSQSSVKNSDDESFNASTIKRNKNSSKVLSVKSNSSKKSLIGR